MDVIVPITKSSIFGKYTPVNDITLALSSEISDSPMVVEIIRFPYNTTLPANLRGAVVIKSPGSTCRFLDSNFLNYLHLKIFEFFLLN